MEKVFFEIFSQPLLNFLYENVTGKEKKMTYLDK